MYKAKPIFYSALLLTGVNLLLRFVGTAFQVYLSSRIGAAGIGLLQLVLSVGSLTLVAGMAGIRTATMYLTAEELGRGHPGRVKSVLSGCMVYSIICSGTVGAAVFFFAPTIASSWIRQPQTTETIRLFTAFLPVNCLTGVMVGYFTGAQRIRTLAAVEVAEQGATMAVTMTLLGLWAGNDEAKCCIAVVMGSGIAGCLTLVCLMVLRLREHHRPEPPLAVGRRLLAVAAPLAVADDLRTGISTAENLIVPRRLALFDPSSPLAAFGIVTGMVFPILMFPACILYGLTELLIPELARCNAAGNRLRIHYLLRRSLKLALVYGLLMSGLLFLSGPELCGAIYGHTEAGRQLRLYALMIPMLYCDNVTDAMTKGMGQQKICVFYNIVTSLLDVLLLYILLPRYGMSGYFCSFFVTHLINFILSLRRLLRITNLRFRPHIPMFGLAAWGSSMVIASFVPQSTIRLLAYPVLLGCMLYLFGVLRLADLRWLKGLLRKKKVPC